MNKYIQAPNTIAVIVSAKNNTAITKSEDFVFAMGIPGKIKESKKIIFENKSNLYSIQYSTDYHNTFGKLINYELYGIRVKIFVRLDTKSRNLKLDDINGKIAEIK